ncbi:hypothetical protein [Streptomyces sp. NPDC002054]|uniref:hypothetical protein n=1 Tax=Streptomyces sp. NPDC002054 TaxID=3154663 RepID=UPI0033299BCF
MTGQWEHELAQQVETILTTVDPPAETVVADLLWAMEYHGGRVAFYVLCSFDEQGRRTEQAENALANWEAVNSLRLAELAAGPWGKAVSLARVLRDLLRTEQAHVDRLDAETRSTP